MTYDPFFETRPEPPAGQRRPSPATWAAVREDYLAGDSAGQVCERHGVGMSALRTRARDEGWRRGDLPDPAPRTDEPCDRDEEPLPAAALAALAWQHTSAAVRQGRLRDAVGWERLARNLRRRAAEEARESSAARDAALARIAADANEIARTLDAVRRSRPGALEKAEALAAAGAFPLQGGGLGGGVGAPSEVGRRDVCAGESAPPATTPSGAKVHLPASRPIRTIRTICTLFAQRRRPTAPPAPPCPRTRRPGSASGWGCESGRAG